MDKETIEKFDLRQFVKSWLLPLAAEIAILLVIFNFVINITYVPTGSIDPHHFGAQRADLAAGVQYR